MSAGDISEIPTVSQINDAEYRRAYRIIIKLLPRIVRVLNNTNPDITTQMKLQRLDRIVTVIDANLQIMKVAMGQVPETDPAFTDFPET